MIFVPVGRSGLVGMFECAGTRSTRKTPLQGCSPLHINIPTHAIVILLAPLLPVRLSIVSKVPRAAGWEGGTGTGSGGRGASARPEPERPGIGPRPVRGQHRGAQPPTACREQRLPSRLQYTQAHRSLSVHACKAE